jgi:hypothetical protein
LYPKYEEDGDFVSEHQIRDTSALSLAATSDGNGLHPMTTAIIVTSQRSSRKACLSPFLRTMQELQQQNPVYANVLERLARQMIARASADVSTEQD